MNKILYLTVLSVCISGCDSFKSVDCSTQKLAIESSISSLQSSFDELNKTVLDSGWINNDKNYISSSENAIKAAKSQLETFDKTKKSNIEACDAVSKSLIDLYKSVTQFNILQNLIIQDVNSSKEKVCKSLDSEQCNKELNMLYEKELKAKSVKIQKDINNSVNNINLNGEISSKM